MLKIFPLDPRWIYSFCFKLHAYRDTQAPMHTEQQEEKKNKQVSNISISRLETMPSFSRLLECLCVFVFALNDITPKDGIGRERGGKCVLSFDVLEWKSLPTGAPCSILPE